MHQPTPPPLPSAAYPSPTGDALSTPPAPPDSPRALKEGKDSAGMSSDVLSCLSVEAQQAAQIVAHRLTTGNREGFRVMSEEGEGLMMCLTLLQQHGLTLELRNEEDAPAFLSIESDGLHTYSIRARELFELAATFHALAVAMKSSAAAAVELEG